MADERNKTRFKQIEEIEQNQADLLKSIEETKALTEETAKMVQKAKQPSPQK